MLKNYSNSSKAKKIIGTVECENVFCFCRTNVCLCDEHVRITELISEPAITLNVTNTQLILR